MLNYLGYTYEELAEGTGELMQGIIAPEDWERVERSIYESIKETGEYDVQYRVVRKDGARLWVDDRGHEITTEDGRKAMISVMLDISEDVKAREKLRQEAMEDPLTGIWNRKGAVLYIEKYLQKCQPGALFLVEFLLFLAGCIQEDVVRKRAENICEAFKESTAQYDKAKLSVSIGIALGDGSKSFSRLYKKADDRMYEVKRAGKGSFKY